MASAAGDFPFLLHACDVPLHRHDSAADPVLELGKRHNVALAAPYFDGLELAPDRPFSFWRALGRITRARGFRHGMELRGGCIVPALGGGICLLSNALFRMACELGWTILERHGHTLDATPPTTMTPSEPPGMTASVVPAGSCAASRPDRAGRAPADLGDAPGDGRAAANSSADDSAIPWGMDATVFWPHVDLRFAPRHGRVRLDVAVVGDVLRIAARSDRPGPDIAVTLESREDRVVHSGAGSRRHNRIVRRIECRSTGRALARDVVAENQKRLLDTHARQRSCLTCDQHQCHARPRETDALIQLRQRLVGEPAP